MSRKIDNLFDSITSTNARFEKLLSNRGSDINALNREGNSLLYVAAEKNQLDKINFLLDNGADVNIKNERGITPLNVAVPVCVKIFTHVLMVKFPDPILILDAFPKLT